MGAMAYRITSFTTVSSTVYSGADQRKQHQSSAPLAFVWGFHRGPVNSQHKWPVTPIMFSIDDIIMRKFVFTLKHIDIDIKLPLFFRQQVQTIQTLPLFWIDIWLKYFLVSQYHSYQWHIFETRGRFHWISIYSFVCLFYLLICFSIYFFLFIYLCIYLLFD